MIPFKVNTTTQQLSLTGFVSNLCYCCTGLVAVQSTYLTRSIAVERQSAVTDTIPIIINYLRFAHLAYYKQASFVFGSRPHPNCGSLRGPLNDMLVTSTLTVNALSIDTSPVAITRRDFNLSTLIAFQADDTRHDSTCRRISPRFANLNVK